MRVVLVRDANLAFAITAVLFMGVMGSVGWNHSIAIQRAREATIQATEESRLLEALSEAEAASDRVRLDYRSTGNAADFAAFRDSAAAIHGLTRQIKQIAAQDPTDGRQLVALAETVDARDTATEREVGPRGNSGSTAEALSMRAAQPGAPGPDLVPRVTEAARIARKRRLFNLELVTQRLRVARWLGAAVALLGIGCVLSMVHQLGRAWRRLRQAELQSRSVASQLRASLDSLSQGVAVFSETGALANWNLRLGQLLDLPPGMLQRGLGYHALEQHLATDDTAFLEPISAVLADAPGVGDLRPVVYERTLHRADNHSGGASRAQIELRRTLMPQGGFVLTVTDMTERVRSERLLRDTQKMQALGQLTGGIAHDFNNMLTVILGSLEVGPDEFSAPAEQRVQVLLNRMQRATQAASSGAALTRQLLGFARKQPLTPRSADLSGRLPELMPLIRHTIGEATQVTFEIEPGLWPAMVDVGQLQSAVLNLALNARDAMPEGGQLIVGAGNVRFDAAHAAPVELPPGDYVRISVADTGHGMSREIIARAFEPFFTTKSEGHGTGLGLAMVFSFTSQSDGRAMIQSEAGLGTTISMFFPRSLQLPAPAQPDDPAADDAAVSLASGVERHILLVDDDSSVREVAADILRGLGYRVSEAGNAIQALDLVGHEADHDGGFALLLTDITLQGGMDGTELATRIKALSPAIHVLYMSGSLDRSVVTGPDCQHQQWLGKPFRRRELAEAVDRALGLAGTNGTLAASGSSL